jgi:hypothetical protein
MTHSNGQEERLPCPKALGTIFALSLLAWLLLILVSTGLWIVYEHFLLWRRASAPITGIDVPAAAPGAFRH